MCFSYRLALSFLLFCYTVEKTGCSRTVSRTTERRNLMKQAVMYGGGNIGRGFIGALFSQSGYQVTFIDVAEAVVSGLASRKSYPVRYVAAGGNEDVMIENVTAVNGNDTEAAAERIARCDIMATAVGARILPYIVPNIVAGIRRRIAENGAPLNIIICENLNDANKILEGMLKEQLTPEEISWFDENIGLVEASIGRMVPVQTEEMKDGDPLRVCVERYGFLPVDKDAFKGDIPQIRNMVPSSPFDFYVKRKLYVHNMGHATCAYLGGLQDLDLIWEAIDVPEIRIIAQNAMLESAQALSAHYGTDLSAIQDHILDLLHRFSNAALGDTCARVGGDPARKLSPADRMIGSSALALTEGICPSHITVGAAAGVWRYISETEGWEQSLETAAKVLQDVSGLDAESRLTAMILDRYRLILEGKSLSEIRRYADEQKALYMTDII